MIDPGAMTQTAKFTIGRVLNQTLVILLRHAVPFIVIAAILAAPYIAFSITYPPDPARVFVGSIRKDAVLSFLMNSMSIVGPAFTASLLTSATLAEATLQALRGESVTPWRSFRHGFARPLTLVGSIAAFTVLYWAGYILYFLPSLPVVVVLWPSMPVVVFEKNGIIAGLKRSGALTKGVRWRLLGLLLLTFAAFLACIWAEWLLLRSFLSFRVIQYIYVGTWAILSAFNAVMVNVGYHSLRADRDGLGVAEVADVFG